MSSYPSTFSLLDIETSINEPHYLAHQGVTRNEPCV